MITIQYTSRHFKKIPTFSTFRSPIDVDNRNLVVPYKRVRHPSQLHILYMFYTYFFTRNPLRWVPDMSDPSRTPSSTSTTATWWSPTSKFVIQVNLTYYTCFMPNFSQGIHLDGSQTCQTLLEHPHRRRQPQPGGPPQASSSSKSTEHIIHVLYLISNFSQEIR